MKWSVDLETLSRDSSARSRPSLNHQSRQCGTALEHLDSVQSLEQREYLRVGTIRIPRAGDLSTRAHIFASSA